MIPKQSFDCFKLSFNTKIETSIQILFSSILDSSGKLHWKLC